MSHHKTIALIQADLSAIVVHLHKHPPTPETLAHLVQLAQATKAARQWVTGEPKPSQEVKRVKLPTEFFNRPKLSRSHESS